MKTPHTVTRRGKTVRVELRNGEVFEGKFLERTPGKWLLFQCGRRIHVGEVKAFSDKMPTQRIGKHRRVGN